MAEVSEARVVNVSVEDDRIALWIDRGLKSRKLDRIDMTPARAYLIASLLLSNAVRLSGDYVRSVDG